MTVDEYHARCAELLSDLPQEFHAPLNTLAYENGHASGYEEIVYHLSEMVSTLRHAIETYTKRIRAEQIRSVSPRPEP